MLQHGYQWFEVKFRHLTNNYNTVYSWCRNIFK